MDLIDPKLAGAIAGVGPQPQNLFGALVKWVENESCAANTLLDADSEFRVQSI